MAEIKDPVETLKVYIKEIGDKLIDVYKGIGIYIEKAKEIGGDEGEGLLKFYESHIEALEKSFGLLDTGFASGKIKREEFGAGLTNLYIYSNPELEGSPLPKLYKNGVIEHLSYVSGRLEEIVKVVNPDELEKFKKMKFPRPEQAEQGETRATA